MEIVGWAAPVQGGIRQLLWMTTLIMVLGHARRPHEKPVGK